MHPVYHDQPRPSRALKVREKPWERGRLASPSVRRDERMPGGDALTLRGWPAYAWGHRGRASSAASARAPSGPADFSQTLRAQVGRSPAPASLLYTLYRRPV